MNIEFISKNAARRQTLETIKEFLKKNKDKIDELMAREAKGMAKLEKVAIQSSAEAEGTRRIVSDYSGGVHGRKPRFNSVGHYSEGLRHNANKLRGEQNPDSFSPGASKTHGQFAYKSEIPMGVGVTGPTTPMTPPAPSNICMGCGGEDTEPLGNHMGLDHFMCRDCGEVGVTIKEENQQADQNQAQDALAAMASQSLAPMVKKDPSDTSEDDRKNTPEDDTKNAYKQAWLSQKRKKQEMNKAAIPMGKSVEAIRQAAGLTGAPKMPSVKAPSIPITGANAPQKDAFATGGMNPTTAAAMGKSEESDKAAGLRREMVDSAKSGHPKKGTAGGMANDALRGEMFSESFQPGAATSRLGRMGMAYKSEMNPSKKPFNTGAGHGGVPAKEVPNQDVAVESAREGTVPPPEEGGKEVSAPGSGGQIKKASLKKDEMVPSALCKVADIRANAAASYAAKRSQQAADVKAIQAVQSAIQKADGIPSAPKAPGAGAVKAAPVKAPPSNQAPQVSSPTPPKL